MNHLTPAQRQTIMNHLRDDRKIQAIKLFREYTGTGLREAKNAVEQLQANPDGHQDSRPGYRSDDRDGIRQPSVTRIDIQNGTEDRSRLSGIHMLMLLLFALALLAIWKFRY